MFVTLFAAGENAGNTRPIGKITAATGWRGWADADAEAARKQALHTLMREAEEYGADAITDVAFEIETLAGVDVETPSLRRIIATGQAVRYSQAA